ncbi:MAG: hypothetical protein HUJ75_05940 [Parasporobacterium sp.]|nr:hypothetical protein [Parasporobacterium sp.]
MLLDYIKNNYKENEPIFLSDIELPVSDTNLRQMFKVLCDSGKIERFDSGVYYLKGTSRLKGGSTLTADQVARSKYIARKNLVTGYYSGYTFANQLGLTTQVPMVVEIVTNLSSAKYREVSIQSRKIILRKPRIEITEENSAVLQLLDLLKDLDQYVDDDTSSAAEKITTYIKSLSLKREDVDKYIGFYPDRVYRYIYEMRLYNAFA